MVNKEMNLAKLKNIVDILNQKPHVMSDEYRVDLVIIEWLDEGKTDFLIAGLEDTLNACDKLRAKGFSPKLVKAVKWRTTLTDLLDLEIIHRMRIVAREIEKNDYIITADAESLAKGVRELNIKSEHWPDLPTSCESEAYSESISTEEDGQGIPTETSEEQG